MLINDKDFLFSSQPVVQHIKNYLQEQGLSKRESEVVIFVVQGLTNKQVADHLCVAEKTVKFHLTNVYKRMKISCRSQIIWTLPIKQFIEHAKIVNQNSNAQPVSQLDFATKEEENSNDNTIPVGHSTVTDNL